MAGVDLGVERPLVGVVGRLEDRAEPVRRDLVGAHDAEVALVGVEAEDVRQVLAERGQRAAVGAPGASTVDGVLVEARGA